MENFQNSGGIGFIPSEVKNSSAIWNILFTIKTAFCNIIRILHPRTKTFSSLRHTSMEWYPESSYPTSRQVFCSQEKVEPVQIDFPNFGPIYSLKYALVRVRPRLFCYHIFHVVSTGHRYKDSCTVELCLTSLLLYFVGNIHPRIALSSDRQHQQNLSQGNIFYGTFVKHALERSIIFIWRKLRYYIHDRCLLYHLI